MEAMKTHTFLDKRALDQKSMDVTSPDYCLNNDCKLQALFLQQYYLDWQQMMLIPSENDLPKHSTKRQD